MTNTNDEVKPPRTSAILTYPVELIEGIWAEVILPTTLHVTMAYFPDVYGFHYTEGNTSRPLIPKDRLLDLMREYIPKRPYRLMPVEGVDAFGPDKTIPVLRVGQKMGTHFELLASEQSHIRDMLVTEEIFPDVTYKFKPHVTVPLPVALRPPSQVLLRPLELWYADDEPVVV